MATLFSVTFVVAIAMFNIVLGFSIALYLNRGPRRLREGIGARWRYRVAALRYGEAAILDDGVLGAPECAADSEPPVPAAEGELTTLPLAEETVGRLKLKMETFERTVVEFEDWLAKGPSSVSDMETRLESLQQEAQTFLDKVNRLITPLAAAIHDDAEHSKQNARLRDLCEELWKEINELLGKTLNLRINDVEPSLVPLREFARSIHIALAVTKRQIDEPVLVLG